METHYHPDTSHHQLSGSWQGIFGNVCLKNTRPYFVYFVGLEFLACVWAMGGDLRRRSCACTCYWSRVLEEKGEHLSSMAWLSSRFLLFVFVKFWSGKILFGHAFLSCFPISLCPQEKLDLRKAVMKLICSYLSSF